MSLQTLHDRARNLGLGRMYEKHWSGSGFRDLFDQTSPQWSQTQVPEKVVDLKAFESAGLPVDELIQNYRETYGQGGDTGHILDSLPETMRVYRNAGYCPRLPDDMLPRQ